MRGSDQTRTLRPRRALAAILLWGVSCSAAADPGISAERCAGNKAAGAITYLTSFGYAASSGILDVVAAQQLGYFAALCLKVDIQPGSNNAQLVSAGTAQMAAMGDAASVMVAIDNGADLVGLLTYGNSSAIELITLKSSKIAGLKDLAGKTIGYKVAPSPQVEAMLAAAGVDIGKVNFVSVGFDPIILANGRIDALTAYKSNEPRTLEGLGYEVTEWDPEKFGVHATFNVLVANRGWAAAHPSAVEDFLRATLHAYGWITADDANLDRALGFAQALSTGGFDLKVSKQRWLIEADMIKAALPHGSPLGRLDDAAWQPEADMLWRAKLVSRPPRVADAHDNRYLDAIYHELGLIWPAP
jgi:NitT/TauT family transport system substrate-binding protein